MSMATRVAGDQRVPPAKAEGESRRRKQKAKAEGESRGRKQRAKTERRSALCPIAEAGSGLRLCAARRKGEWRSRPSAPMRPRADMRISDIYMRISLNLGKCGEVAAGSGDQDGGERSDRIAEVVTAVRKGNLPGRPKSHVAGGWEASPPARTCCRYVRVLRC